MTGLSRSTVGQRLDQLFAAGWLRTRTRRGSLTGGRPSTHLRFDSGHAAVLAADLGHHLRPRRRAGPVRRVLAEHTAELLHRPAARTGVLGRARPVVRQARSTTAGSGGRAVCGVGLSVPGPVDWTTGVVGPAADHARLGRIPVPARMQQELARHAGLPASVPVLVDNDANLMALGEQRDSWRDCSAFVLVKVGTGIGAGVVIDGNAFRGIDGGAGDLGHIRCTTRPTPCACAAPTAASPPSPAAARWPGSSAPSVSPRAPPPRCASTSTPGSPTRCGWPARPAGAAERCWSLLSPYLNPGVLMIAGDLAETHFVTGVRELLYQRALPRATRNLQVVTSRLGDRAALAGATAMVVEHLYAPDQANERLAAAAPDGNPGAPS